MLAALLIFLALNLTAAFLAYKSPNPTVVLLAKMVFYSSLIIFFILLFTFIFNSAPPIASDNKKLPL